MSEEKKTRERIEREERINVAVADSRWRDEEVRRAGVARFAERLSETYAVYQDRVATAQNDRDARNMYCAFRAAKKDDEHLDYLVGGRRYSDYLQRVKEAVDKRMRQQEYRERESYTEKKLKK